MAKIPTIFSVFLQKHKSVGTIKRFFRIFKGILKTLEFLFFGQSIISPSGLQARNNYMTQAL